MEASGSQEEGGRFAPTDVPAKVPFRTWLHGSLVRERDPKTGSLGSVSERHLDALAELRRELLRDGYSRRQVAKGNLVETAIEILYAHVFDGRSLK